MWNKIYRQPNDGGSSATRHLGFIFYDRSKRNYEGVIPKLPKTIKKTGVFVNEYLEIVVSLAEEYQLEALQLHGEENSKYIKELKKYLLKPEIMKVFGIKDSFNFSDLEPYLKTVDYFFFDTKRAKFMNATDQEVLEAAYELTKIEGIIPALETAHALAVLPKLVFNKDQVVVINLSGRGDKDLETYMKHLEA